MLLNLPNRITKIVISVAKIVFNDLNTMHDFGLIRFLVNLYPNE